MSKIEKLQAEKKIIENIPGIDELREKIIAMYNHEIYVEYFAEKERNNESKT